MIQCKRCENKDIRCTYTGETKDIYKRSLKHAAGLRLKYDDNVLHNHGIDEHKDEKDMEMEDFRVTVTSK